MKKGSESRKRQTAMRLLCPPTTRPMDADAYLCGCITQCKAYCPVLCGTVCCYFETCPEYVPPNCTMWVSYGCREFEY